MFQNLNKKSLLYLIIAGTVSFLVVGWFWFSKVEIEEISMPEKLEREKIIKQQLDELGQLREGAPLFTEEEVKIQLKELEKIRQKTNLLSQKPKAPAPQPSAKSR